MIKYAQRLVLLTTPSGERIEYEGIQLVPRDNVDNERKAIPSKTPMRSNQHSSSTTLPHPAVIPSQISSDSKELEVSQAKIMPLFPQ